MNKKISVVFFLTFLGGGGTERIIANIINNLDTEDLKYEENWKKLLLLYETNL